MSSSKMQIESVQKLFRKHTDAKPIGVMKQGNKISWGNVPKLLQPYIDVTKNNVRHWFKEGVDKAIFEVKRENYTAVQGYLGAVEYMVNAFEDNFKFPEIERRKIVVIGSLSPWVESTILASGAKNVSTMDYNPPVSHDERITIIDMKDIDMYEKNFDYIVSISSIEHDGLGRYGDPINPDGDRAAILELWTMLKDDGLLFLHVPLNARESVVVFNQHREYNASRLNYILKDYFRPLSLYDMDGRRTLQDFWKNPSKYHRYYAPLIVLEKINY